MKLADMEHLHRVLVALNTHRIRATYGAVGEYLAHVHKAQHHPTRIDQVPKVDHGKVGSAVGQMLKTMDPSWHTSWIVPTGKERPKPVLYNKHNTHPDLPRHNWIITTGGELALLITLCD